MSTVTITCTCDGDCVCTVTIKRRRGTSNSNARGSNADRRARKLWLLETYRADVDVIDVDGQPACRVPVSEPTEKYVDLSVVPIETVERRLACRCYRCGELLTENTVTVDRIIPGCEGGTYRRNNIRPACADDNSETGGRLGAQRKRAKREKA